MSSPLEDSPWTIRRIGYSQDRNSGQGDTYGNDKFFEVSADGDVLKLRGANFLSDGNYSSFLPDGTPDRYLLVHGTGVPGEETNTLIDVPLSEGKMTVHYKASNQRIDLWHDNTLLVKNFQAIRGDYTARAIQLGGGGASFEYTLWDNVFFGVGAIPGDANGDVVVDVADLGISWCQFWSVWLDVWPGRLQR